MSLLLHLFLNNASSEDGPKLVISSLMQSLLQPPLSHSLRPSYRVTFNVTKPYHLLVTGLGSQIEDSVTGHFIRTHISASLTDSNLVSHQYLAVLMTIFIFGHKNHKPITTVSVSALVSF